MSAAVVARPSLLSLVWLQARAEMTAFWRTPIAAFFTLVFPLVLLGLIGLLVGDAVLDSRSGVRITQFITPAIGAYAAATAAYTSLAISLSIDRESGVLRRQRTLPVPAGALLAGRGVSGVITGMLAMLVMVVFGVLRYDVQIVWAKAPAAVVTALVGIGAFAALGFAVSSIARTPSATQAITNATLIPLGFISDVFVVGDGMPEWLSRVGGVFPLRPFANAMGEAFNPFTAGSGFVWSHLGLMALWGIGGAVVAARRFSWAHTPSTPRAGGAGSAAPVPPVVRAAAGLGQVEEGRPAGRALVAGQVRDGIVAVLRTPSSAFFTIAFPVVTLLLFSAVFGNPELDDKGGVPLSQHLAPALGIFGVATVTYAEFAERVASQRDRGILKRVRGTPLTVGQFLAGRVGASVVLGVATSTLVMAVGVVTLDMRVPVARVPLAMLVLAIGVGAFTLLGLALVTLAPTADAVSPLANGTLLPLAFISDVFLIGDLPAGLQRVADAFPLRPAVTAFSDVLNPELDVVVPVGRLLVVLAWGAVAALIVSRRFQWAPRR